MASYLRKDTELAEVFASWEGMEGVQAPLSRTRRPPYLDTARAIYPGLLVASTVALCSILISEHYRAPVMLLTLLFGMSLNFLHQEGRCVPGIEFTSKVVLRTGVALLGARITVGQIASLGAGPIVAVMTAVALTIGLGAALAPAFKLGRGFGILSGGAVAICGASAALAIASVLPSRKRAAEETIVVVIGVTSLSTVAMILYPLLAGALHLDRLTAGIFLGGAIHDVAQVVGAGYSISPETGDVATYVKLLRVALLAPVVFGLAFAASRLKGGRVSAGRPPMPWFLLAFVGLVVLGSLGQFGPSTVEVASTISRWCLVAAIAALGMKTTFKGMIDLGWAPIALMVLETAWIAAIILSYLVLFR